MAEDVVGRGEAPAAPETSPDLLHASLLTRLPRRLRGVLVLGVVAALAATAYLGSLYYPDARPPQGSDLERRIASVFGLPADTADDRLIGDYLVERFYALNVETGERYVADFIKGRIQGVQSLLRDDGSRSYTLLLDLRNLQRDRALYAAFVDEVARPDLPGAEYLGLRAFVGNNDAFAVNYDGNIPDERRLFRGPNGEELFAFLLKQPYAEVTASPRLVGVDGYNFLLSSSDRFQYFRSQFGVKALLLSELVIVDATARPQATTLFRLRQQFPLAR